MLGLRLSKIAAVATIAACSLWGLNASATGSADPTDASVTGKWSGNFDITSADGRVKPDTALFTLKQDGNTLTGTAGPNAEKQMEIKEGKVEGQEIQFSVQLAQGGKPLVFHLHRDGDHMKGEASGDMPDGPAKVAIDVTREHP